MAVMKLTLFRNSLFFLFLLFAVTPAFANDVLIYYSTGGTNTSSQYSNLKSQLEDLGFTVTGSTSGTVSSNAVSGKELVIDLTGTSNCGSTCKTTYDNYVSGGGKLLIAGTNGATNRNSSIEALIESKMGVGSFTQGGGSNGGYQNIARGNYASSTSSENILPGTDKFMYNVSGGEMVSANSATSTYEMWHKWDYGSNGGAVYVTFGYGQFLSTHTYASNMDDFLYRALTEEGLVTTTTTYTSSISTAQTNQITASRAVTHNGSGIYINQVGNDNELDIVQDGSDNLIAGVGSTSSNIVNADIIGNNNDTTLTQRGDNNVILFDVTGDTNTTTVSQGGSSGADDNRLEFDVNGDSNILSITQNHNDGIGNNGHFLAIDLDGDTNNILSSQLNDGDKKAFLSVQGDDNDIDLYQQGSGSHYAEIAVGSDQTVGITQDGTGNHNASVSMTGHSATLDLTQDSSTNQVYSINQNCANANGCGTTTVTQN
tara:strand:+ start:2197 stop:3654 length:1458 start_codon:yes stop_codon:yes gene_type:complete